MGPYVKIYSIPKYLKDYKNLEHPGITLILKIHTYVNFVDEKFYVH